MGEEGDESRLGEREGERETMMGKALVAALVAGAGTCGGFMHMHGLRGCSGEAGWGHFDPWGLLRASGRECG